MRIIGYERVSTVRQGASGLGIAAQRQAIEGFAAQRNATLIARFTEVESGRNADGVNGHPVLRAKATPSVTRCGATERPRGAR